MGYLILQIILCLILAAILGFLIGWLLKIWPNKDKISKLEQKLNYFENDVNTKHSNFNQSVSNLKTGFDDHSGQLSGLVGLSDKLSVLENQFKTDLVDKKYDSKLEDLMNKFSGIEGKINELYGKDFEKEIQALNSNLKSLEEKSGKFYFREEVDNKLNEHYSKFADLENAISTFTPKINNFYSKDDVDSKIVDFNSKIFQLETSLNTKRPKVNELEEKLNNLLNKKEIDYSPKFSELDNALTTERSKLNELDNRFNVVYNKSEVDSKFKDYFEKCSALENKFNNEINLRDARIKELEEKLEALANKKPEKPKVDDLTRISGVGPVLVKMLHSKGIYSFEQVARLNEAEVNELDKFLKFTDRIRRENWREQAKKLHQEKYGEII